MTEDQKKAMAKALGINEEERVVLDIGADHAFNCRCETCADYWRAMGPDPDGVPNKPYGPFTAAEIENDSPDGKRCKAYRESIEREQGEEIEGIDF